MRQVVILSLFLQLFNVGAGLLQWRQPLHWLLYCRKEVGYSALFHFQVLSDLFCISDGRANTFRKIKVRFNQPLLRALMQTEASY